MNKALQLSIFLPFIYFEMLVCCLTSVEMCISPPSVEKEGIFPSVFQFSILCELGQETNSDAKI